MTPEQTKQLQEIRGLYARLGPGLAAPLILDQATLGRLATAHELQATLGRLATAHEQHARFLLSLVDQQAKEIESLTATVRRLGGEEW